MSGPVAPTPPPRHRERDRLIYAGLLTTAVAAVLQLVDKPLTVWLGVAVRCFAIAIPLLSGCLVVEIDPYRPAVAHRRWQAAVVFVGVAAAVAGLIACFAHMHPAAALVFVAAAGVAVAYVWSF